MGRVSTNATSWSYAIETTETSGQDSGLGTLPAQPSWVRFDPNDISTFGGENSTTQRSPISKDRQRRKSLLTDRDSSVEFDADLTMSHFLDFSEGFVFAKSLNFDLSFAESNPKHTQHLSLIHI